MRDQFWFDHFRALQEQGHSLSVYTQANGLSPGSVYRARSRLKRRGLLSEPEPTALVRAGPAHILLDAVTAGIAPSSA